VKETSRGVRKRGVVHRDTFIFRRLNYEGKKTYEPIGGLGVVMLIDVMHMTHVLSPANSHTPHPLLLGSRERRRIRLRLPAGLNQSDDGIQSVSVLFRETWRGHAGFTVMSRRPLTEMWRGAPWVQTCVDIAVCVCVCVCVCVHECEYLKVCEGLESLTLAHLYGADAVLL